MGKEIKTNQVDGGEWQARYEGGGPNEFGKGATEKEAIVNLRKSLPLESPGQLDTLTAEPKLRHEINATVDRIIIKKLPHPIQHENGKVVSHAAYRESDPSVQSYGVDENSARVQFLTDNQPRRKVEPKAEPAAK